MPKFLNNIDLTKNELQNAVIQNLATDPTSPFQGQIYFNTVSKKFLVYNNTSWAPMNDLSSANISDWAAAIAANATVSANTAKVGFTNALAIASVLTGFVSGANSTVLAADSILGAFQKVQGQITADKAAIALNTAKVGYTDALVRACTLTGFVSGANSAVLASDSILAAFGKVQGQITADKAAIALNTAKVGFTEALVRATVLTGLPAATDVVISAADSILTAAGKLQGQVASAKTRASHTGTQLASTISDLASVVKAYRKDEFANPTAAMNMNNQKLTNVGAPTVSTDGATKGYVDSVATGLDVKASCRVASVGANVGTYNATGGATGRGQITAAPNALDGVTLVVGNRILLKDQTNGASNGIWQITTLGAGVDGVWDRATACDSDAEVTSGLFTFVEEGAVNDNSGWILSTNNPIVLGGASGTVLVFTQFSGAGQITAGDGMTKSGNTLNVVGTAGRIAANADAIDLVASGVGAGTYRSVTVDTYGRVTAGTNPSDSSIKRFSQSVGDAAAVSFVVTHNLATTDLSVSVYRVASPFDVVMTDVEMTSANTITVRFATAPTLNQYRVVILG